MVILKVVGVAAFVQNREVGTENVAKCGGGWSLVMLDKDLSTQTQGLTFRQYSVCGLYIRLLRSHLVQAVPESSTSFQPIVSLAVIPSYLLRELFSSACSCAHK